MDNILYNCHYIALREDGAIIFSWSDGPFPDKDTTNAICINDRGGYQFRFTENGEENPPLYDIEGIPLYKWDGKQVVSRLEDEIEAERNMIPLPPPSPMEQLRADVDFLLVMGGLS